MAAPRGVPLDGAAPHDQRAEVVPVAVLTARPHGLRPSQQRGERAPAAAAAAGFRRAEGRSTEFSIELSGASLTTGACVPYRPKRVHRSDSTPILPGEFR